MNLRSVQSIAHELSGKTVLLRASLNVPLDDSGVVRNYHRIETALPTIELLRAAGAKVVVMAHIGRAADETLYPVYTALAERTAVTWGGVITSPECTSAIASLADGDVLLVENLRQDAREQANDETFAAEIAALADVYVNDSFASMHRAHASTVGVTAHLPSYAGLQVLAEVTALQQAMRPKQPALFMLGGAKFATKLQLVQRYMDIYDEVFIGGAIAHDILRVRGYEVGHSLVSDLTGVDTDFMHDARIVVPSDVVVIDSQGESVTKPVDAVLVTDTIYDCGPATVSYLSERIANAATVLWNGPFGNYEAGYSAGTEAVATALAESSAKSYVGGGDTVAAIEALHRAHDFTFVSTGGGAMLSFLETGNLPALTPLLEGR